MDMRVRDSQDDLVGATYIGFVFFAKRRRSARPNDAHVQVRRIFVSQLLGAVMDGKFIACYRVSTDHQGVNGSGIAAQRNAVVDYLIGGMWKLVGEFPEVESGNVDQRSDFESSLLRHGGTGNQDH
jgi:hypothetical protein